MTRGKRIYVLDTNVLMHDPTALFRALQILRRAGRISPDRLRVTFRATGHDAAIRSMIDAAGVADLVEIAPPIAMATAPSQIKVTIGFHQIRTTVAPLFAAVSPSAM